MAWSRWSRMGAWPRLKDAGGNRAGGESGLAGPVALVARCLHGTFGGGAKRPRGVLTPLKGTERAQDILS